jgi:spermidine/putrescine transport system ATP-binding protein
VGLAAPGTPHSIPATVIRAVYFGTDTHYHLRLASGESLIARQQNRGGAAVTEGEAVGVTLREGAVRVLDD